MANDESGWVFDSLIGFLQGPVWSAPLLTFIEERSLIFENDTDDSKEYREAYQEYKNLVDLLLGCYMEDMGISPEQFEYACTVNKNTKMPVQFQQCLFEQIWAANEYGIFKRMMIQKNLELQLQALNMIEQKFGLTPASLTCGSDGIPDDEIVMEELIHKHIQEEVEDNVDATVEANLDKEHERLANQYHNERAALEEALRASVESSKSLQSLPEENPEETKDDVEQYLSEEIPKPKMMKRPAPLAPIPQESKESDKKKEIDLENRIDMKKREDYLKARRDKLVALKKEARSQRLQMTKERPSSARNVAEATMNGKQNLENSQVNDSSILQVRKALAARLKAEVVGQ
ncbi:hypothetical protein PV325_005672 [Microctonus aethiopoides]|uniref:Cilia- and flagella-associated protein 36 n=1 Tax=Microctonus aethiopoides TaxID=144406 RepID=A0AA39F6H2_9HYME|nr:hypothetical protein PV325_005672 [Microctonus aethiopoides]KAK0163844.1 hypothetical protein PV328_002533 [Microctonus aethiopoides]